MVALKANIQRHEYTYQLSLFFSLASRSYFSSVRLSTWPVKYLKQIVSYDVL